MYFHILNMFLNCIVMWFSDWTPIVSALNREDEELTGSEDPSILNSFVANLPAEQAYKEGNGKVLVCWFFDLFYCCCCCCCCLLAFWMYYCVLYLSLCMYRIKKLFTFRTRLSYVTILNIVFQYSCFNWVNRIRCTAPLVVPGAIKESILKLHCDDFESKLK